MARKNPWVDNKWQVISASGLSLPLLLLRGKRDNYGNKTVKQGDNQFRLVVGSRTGKRINYLKVKGKKDTISRYWKDCALVPRGNQPLELIDSTGSPLAPLGSNPTEQQILDLTKKLVDAVDGGRRINTSRLECDIVVPDPGNPKKKVFGLLRLFQVPRALGPESLLVIDVSMDGGLPGGNGGGGSVHN